METVRLMALVVQQPLFFTFEDLRYEDPPLRREERLRALFFRFENNFCYSK